jgi:DNA-binding NarL/FixJ family response regulator
LDIVMPALSGAETTAQIVRAVPDAKILVLSAYSDDERIHQLIEAGANGYLVKQSAGDELLNAIRQVHAGRAYLGPTICKRVLDKCRESLRSRTTLRIAESRILTPRENEVLRLVAEGYANKQIADRLAITVKTVEKHRQELMDRLDLHNTAALTRYALSHGLLENSEPVERN